MTTKEKIRLIIGSPLRIIVLSVIGFAQFTLVMFGCLYIARSYQAAYPWVAYLKEYAMAVGLLSLVYPVYIVMALEPAYRKMKTDNSRVSTEKEDDRGTNT